MALSSPNCLFSALDIAQSGTMDTAAQDISITPDMSTGFPLSNLLTPDLWQGAQFSNNAQTNTAFALDLGSIQPVSIIALLKHNITSGGQWRVRLYDTLANYQAASATFDSGLTAIVPAISTFGVLPWKSFLWGEATSEFDLQGYNRHAYMPLDQVYLVRYISVQFVADTNLSLITAYRFWTGVYYQPTFNADYASELEPVDETSVKKGYSGARTYGQVVKRRQIKLNFTQLPQAEFLYNIYQAIYLRNGIALPILFMTFPKDSTQWMTTSIFGNLQPASPASLPFVEYGMMGANIVIEENV
jgi:hypothetical protein